MMEFLQTHGFSLAILLGLAVALLLLWNRTTRVSSLDEIIGRGEPVIVEVFSNT